MTDPVRLRTRIELGGKPASGFAVPEEVVASTGTGKRPAVRVTVGQHAYRTTEAPMGGRFLVPPSSENRAAAGVAAGDEVDVQWKPTPAPGDCRANDLAEALALDQRARDFFETLAYTHRKE